MHNDYAPTLIEKLKAININPIEYDPFDPNNINDPKYKEDTDEQKQQLAKDLQTNMLNGRSSLSVPLQNMLLHELSTPMDGSRWTI